LTDVKRDLVYQLFGLVSQSLISPHLLEKESPKPTENKKEKAFDFSSTGSNGSISTSSASTNAFPFLTSFAPPAPSSEPKPPMAFTEFTFGSSAAASSFAFGNASPQATPFSFSSTPEAPSNNVDVISAVSNVDSESANEVSPRSRTTARRRPVVVRRGGPKHSPRTGAEELRNDKRVETAIQKLSYLSASRTSSRFVADNGYATQCLASEVVLLLRHLANNENWKKAMLQVFLQSLSKTPKIVAALDEMKAVKSTGIAFHVAEETKQREEHYKSNAELMDDINNLVATLSILGGHIERLRVGAVVLIEDMNKPRGTQGIVINYKLMNLKATVLIQSTTGWKTEEINVDHLVPVSSGKEMLKDISSLTADIYKYVRPLLGIPEKKKKNEKLQAKLEEAKKKDENKSIHYLVTLLRALAVEAMNSMLENRQIAKPSSPLDYQGKDLLKLN
jgi:hypothetical protein